MSIDSHDSEVDANGIIWRPTLRFRWLWMKAVDEVPDGPLLQQLWRRPDTFEERWRAITVVEADQ